MRVAYPSDWGKPILLNKYYLNCRFVQRQHAFHVTGDQFDFQVHFRFDLQVLQGGHGDGVGNQVDRETATVHGASTQVFHAVDGQRHAVDDYGTFQGQVFRQVLLGFDHQFPRFTDGFELAHDAQAINVARNQVTTEALGQGQRFFQVDFGGSVQAHGAIEAFARDIDGKVGVRFFHYRHASAIDGDRIAQRHVGQRQAARMDRQAHACVEAAFQRQYGFNFADCGNNSCKHGQPVKKRVINCVR